MLTNNFTVEIRLLPANKVLHLNYTWGIFLDGLLAEAGFITRDDALRAAAIMQKGF